MVLLPGLRLGSLTVHGFCSLHLGSSYQPERVHLNEGISRGISGKLPALWLPFLLFFNNSIFPCSAPRIVFNFFCVDTSFYTENPFFLFTQLCVFFNNTKIYMDSLSDSIFQTNLGSESRKKEMSRHLAQICEKKTTDSGKLTQNKFSLCLLDFSVK